MTPHRPRGHVRLLPGQPRACACSALALGTSQRLWPALAVRAAGRLFGTPLPPKWLQRRGAWDAGWRIERWPFEDASLTRLLAGRRAPHAPVALLVHGWGGHARPDAAAGRSAGRSRACGRCCVEMPAHGRSAGASEQPAAVRACHRLRGGPPAAARPCRCALLVAHSLGANAAAYAASRGLPVERLVLLAPPASPREYTRLFAHVFGLSRGHARARCRSASRRAKAPDAAVRAARRRRRASACPRWWCTTAATASTASPTARPSPTRSAARSCWPTEGLGHRKILRTPHVLRRRWSIFAADVSGARLARRGHCP